MTVLDDIDDLYRDRDAVNLLKCLCQTEGRKRLGWHLDNATLRREQIPRAFDTSSRVCLIANEMQATNPNVEALLDRGIVVRFDPSSEELHHRAASWFWDQEIFDFIGYRLHWIESASMRDYELASKSSSRV